MRLLGFMGSPLSFLRVHWDHEPGRTVAQASCLWRRTGILPVIAGWKPALHDRQDACPTVTRFLERVGEGFTGREKISRSSSLFQTLGCLSLEFIGVLG